MFLTFSWKVFHYGLYGIRYKFNEKVESFSVCQILDLLSLYSGIIETATLTH